MSIKIIATDLDGTLMSTDHLTITQRTKSALLSAHKKGIKIAIATGRPMALIDYVIEQIPFVDYIIYANGACVFDRNKDKIICQDLIPNETAVEVINYFLNGQTFFEVYVDGRSQYQLDMMKYFETVEFPNDFVDEVAKTMDGHENLLEFLADRGIEKITFYSVKDDNMKPIWDKLDTFGFSIATSFEKSIEATLKTANKGNALKGICDSLGFTSDEAMAFGDAGNDCQMLEYAKYSFAMGNASEDCKSSAKFIAESNANDGLAIEVEKYCL